MAAIYNDNTTVGRNGAAYGGNFLVQKNSPLDDRTLVPTRAALLQYSGYIYKGMVVSVQADNSFWSLVDPDHSNLESSWVEIDSKDLLDPVTGLIKPQYLPSYVDDVIEGYFDADDVDKWVDMKLSNDTLCTRRKPSLDGVYHDEASAITGSAITLYGWEVCVDNDYGLSEILTDNVITYKSSLFATYAGAEPLGATAEFLIDSVVAIDHAKYIKWSNATLNIDYYTSTDGDVSLSSALYQHIGGMVLPTTVTIEKFGETVQGSTPYPSGLESVLSSAYASLIKNDTLPTNTKLYVVTDDTKTPKIVKNVSKTTDESDSHVVAGTFYKNKIEGVYSEPYTHRRSKIYVDLDTTLVYRWGGNIWIEIGSGKTAIATASSPGIVKLGSDATQSVAASTPTSESGRTYPIQMNGNNQLVVNVPWRDHSVIEHTHDIYKTIPADQSDASFQAFLAAIVNIKKDDYYIYKKKIVDNHVGESKTTHQSHDAVSASGDVTYDGANKVKTSGIEEIYSRTAYVCEVVPVITVSGGVYTATSLGTFKALDGNYDASNVYLDSDLVMAGQYSRVGNITKANDTTNGMFYTKGMSVKEVFEHIFMKATWDYTPSYVNSVSCTHDRSVSNNGQPTVYCYVNSGGTTDYTSKSFSNNTNSPIVIKVGSRLVLSGTAGGNLKYNTIEAITEADRRMSYSTDDKSNTATHTATPEHGTSVTYTGGLTAQTSEFTDRENTKYSEWDPSTGRVVSERYVRNAGGGSLGLTISTTGVFGDPVRESGEGASLDSISWDGDDAQTYKVSGAYLTGSGCGYGTCTITSSYTNGDGYLRYYKHGDTAPTSEEIEGGLTDIEVGTNELSSFYELSNIDTVSSLHKTDSISSKSVSFTQGESVSMNNTNGTKYVVLHSVYPFRTNGVIVSKSTADGLLNSDCVFKWASTMNETTDLFDTHQSSGTTKSYYIKFTTLNADQPRYIDLPAKTKVWNATDSKYDYSYVTIDEFYSKGGDTTWQPVAADFKTSWIATTGAPEGYKRYQWTGASGACVTTLKIKI